MAYETHVNKYLFMHVSAFPLNLQKIIYYRNILFIVIANMMSSTISSMVKTCTLSGNKGFLIANQMRTLSVSSSSNQNAARWRESFPIVNRNKEWIFADGGAGTQVAANVIKTMQVCPKFISPLFISIGYIVHKRAPNEL